MTRGVGWGWEGGSEDDEENGIEQLGYVPKAFAPNGRNVCIFNATTMALSADNKYLAIGGADELSGVIVIELD